MSEPAPARRAPWLILGFLLAALPIAGYFIYPVLNPSADRPGSSEAALDIEPEAASAANRRSLIPPPGPLGAAFERDAGSSASNEVSRAGSAGGTAPEVLAGDGPPEGVQADPGTHRQADDPLGGTMLVGVTGSIVGEVRFEGVTPPPTKLDMAKDPACGKANKDGTVAEVAVKDGKLAAVFVSIKEGLPAGGTYPARAEEVTLDQKGCVYQPLMLGLQTGQKLKIINSDPTMHNVHALAKRGEFNLAMPKQGSTLEKSFPKPEGVIEIKCEVHPWMRAHVGIVDHPFFAVSQEDGMFTIKNVPPGTYTLELVHAKLGTQLAQATVAAGGPARVDVVFKAP